MASGIRDKVAILGMGCSKFGERWDMNAENLMVEAFKEEYEDGTVWQHGVVRVIVKVEQKEM